jgi:hypothetical protein
MTINKRQAPAAELAYRYIIEENLTVVGVVFIEMDCQCFKMCGVNRKADILTPLHLVMGPSAAPKDRPPVCPVCLKDGGVNPDRVIRHGIAWSDASNRAIDDRLKRKIERKIFGSKR